MNRRKSLEDLTSKFLKKLSRLNLTQAAVETNEKEDSFEHLSHLWCSSKLRGRWNVSHHFVSYHSVQLRCPKVSYRGTWTLALAWRSTRRTSNFRGPERDHNRRYLNSHAAKEIALNAIIIWATLGAIPSNSKVRNKRKREEFQHSKSSKGKNQSRR